MNQRFNPIRTVSLILVLVAGSLWVGGADAQEQRPHDDGVDFEMVLIHGLGSKAEVWDPILPFLQGTFRVAVFEMAGHGSTQPVMDPTIDTEVARLEDFINSEGMAYPTVVGHGMGGMIALKYAITHPAKVHRLILLDAAPMQLASVEDKAAVARELAVDYDRFVAARYLDMSPDDAIADQIVDTALRTDSATFISLLMSGFDYDVTADLYALSVPMLVVGSELMFPSNETSQHMLEHYGFGSAKSLSFKRFGKTGHYMMLEQPVHLASVLLAFGVTAEYQFDR